MRPKGPKKLLLKTRPPNTPPPHPPPPSPPALISGSGLPGPLLSEGLELPLQSINQSTLFKHGKWLSKLVFTHAVQQLQVIKIKSSG